MEILSVKAENAFQFQNIEFSLKQQGLVLVTGENRDMGGSNGAGKSALLELIQYSLFQESYRTGARDRDAVVNLTSDEPFSLQIEFLDHEGRKWILQQSRKRGSPQSFRANLQTGEKVVATGRAAFEYVRKLLKFEFDEFNSLSFLGQATLHQFVFGTDKVRRDFLDKMFGLDELEALGNLAGERRRKVLQEKDSLALSLENKNERCQELQCASKELQQILCTLQDKTDELQRCEESLEQLQEEVNALEQKEKKGLGVLGELKAKKRQHSEQISKTKRLSKKIESLRKQLADIPEIELPNVSREQEQELQASLSSIQSKLRHLATELKVFADGSCPTCNRPLSEVDCAKLIRPKEKEVSTLQKSLDTQTTQLEKVRLNLKLKRQKEELNRDIRGVETTLKALTPIKIDQVDERLEKVKSKLDKLRQKLESLKTREKALRQQSNQLMKEQGRREEVLRESAALKSDLKDAKKASTTLKAQLEQRVEQLELLEFLVYALGRAGVKRWLYLDLCSRLNRKCAEYMQTLSNGELMVTFTTQTKTKKGDTREKFEILISDGYKDAMELKRWSGGEKKRIVLSILMALWELAREFSRTPANFLFLDEIFGDLDEIGRDQVLRLLEHLRDSLSTVLVISHVPLNEVFFDQRWNIVKEDGVSTLNLVT